MAMKPKNVRGSGSKADKATAAKIQKTANRGLDSSDVASLRQMGISHYSKVAPNVKKAVESDSIYGKALSEKRKKK